MLRYTVLYRIEIHVRSLPFSLARLLLSGRLHLHSSILGDFNYYCSVLLVLVRSNDV